MKKIIVDQHFENSYLKCGATYDNFIFENCPLEFIDLAYDSLRNNCNNVKSCCIKLDGEIEKSLKVLLDKCSNEMQKKIFARDFIVSLIVYEMLKDESVHIKDLTSLDTLKKGITDMLKGDFDSAREFSLEAPMPYDIKRIMNKIGKIELNFFLLDCKDMELQRAINVFIASREPYSVKIFSNSKLASYADQNGTLIETPHDYMSINVNEFIAKEAKKL